jgi:hypothetical protein
MGSCYNSYLNIILASNKERIFISLHKAFSCLNQICLKKLKQLYIVLASTKEKVSIFIVYNLLFFKALEKAKTLVTHGKYCFDMGQIIYTYPRVGL